MGLRSEMEGRLSQDGTGFVFFIVLHLHCIGVWEMAQGYLWDGPKVATDRSIQGA